MTAPKPDAPRCAARIWGTWYDRHPCSRRGVVEEGGKVWCKQHVPSVVAARRDEREARWRRDALAEHAEVAAAERDRRAAAFPGLVAALERVEAEAILLVNSIDPSANGDVILNTVTDALVKARDPSLTESLLRLNEALETQPIEWEKVRKSEDISAADDATAALGKADGER